MFISKGTLHQIWKRLQHLEKRTDWTSSMVSRVASLAHEHTKLRTQIRSSNHNQRLRIKQLEAEAQGARLGLELMAETIDLLARKLGYTVEHVEAQPDRLEVRPINRPTAKKVKVQ